MIWSSTTLQAVSNGFSQACLSIQLPSFLTSADWHEGAASVEFESTSLVNYLEHICMSWMHYLREFFSFDAFSVLVLVLIVCVFGIWISCDRNAKLDLQCMELSSSSHWGLFLHVVLIADITCCGCGTHHEQRSGFSLTAQDRQSKQISIPKQWQDHDCRSQPLCRWLQLSWCWSHCPWAPWLHLT